MNFKNLFCLFPIFLIFLSCQEVKESQERETLSATKQLNLTKDNLFAWCIVPFDSLEREPQARIDMLNELGFTAYAYDWREKHLDEMESEWELAKANGIDITAVWLWIDANSNQPGKLNPANEEVLEKISHAKLKTQVWVGFHSNYFQDVSEEEKLDRGTKMVNYLNDRVKEIDCSLALYNHGDWFGEPENQVKIIETLETDDVGIIFNFHHAHEQIDRFPHFVETMLPYLWAVNLNGLKKGGPKILPIGEGDHERSMLQILQEHGYEGPFGILGHVEEADVREILSKNLSGLAGITL